MNTTYGWYKLTPPHHSHDMHGPDISGWFTCINCGIMTHNPKLLRRGMVLRSMCAKLPPDDVLIIKMPRRVTDA